MEQVTVRELASEFEMKSSKVISELKKIGVWVPSSDTVVDSDIANRIRKRLQMIQEAEQEEKDKKADKGKKPTTAKSRKSIRELGKPRKRTARKKAVEEPEESQPTSLLGGSSLRPRKGRKSAYRKPEVEEISETPETEEITEITPETEIPAEAPEISAESQVETADISAAEIPVEPTEIKEAEPVETEEKEVEEEVTPVPAVEPEPAIETEEVPPLVPTEKEVVEEPPAKRKPEKEKVKKPSRAEKTVTVEAKTTVEAEAQEAEKVKTAAEAEVAAEPRKKIQPVRVKRSVARKKIKKEKARQERADDTQTAVEAGSGEVVFSEKVTVKSFGEKTGVRSAEIIGALMQMGIMATMNQVLDQEIVEKLCDRFEILASFVSFEEEAAIEEIAVDKPEDLTARAPVVTVMGHVDHGKTTLLDFIRETHVAESEEGGITQHIGASNVSVGDKRIVFIDTPGHEAFTRMRARGAQATDIVVLVVAADDGVMPQTLEAIDHAKAAEVPIVVAINKIDKPGANPQRVQQELSDRGLIPEDWGGDTIMVELSAKEGTNIDTLLEMLLLVSELQELKANPKRSAAGVVLEAKMEKGRGTVATLLVQNGTLSVGDNFIAGSSFGKIRAMFTDQGESISEAEPSTAVEILGIQGIPQAGDAFQVVENQAKAREMVEFRQEKHRQEELESRSTKVRSLEDLYEQIEAGEVKELPIILKGDTQGSVEVLDDTLKKLGTEKVKIAIMRKGVGAITESDVVLATASHAIIIGFKVRPEATARSLAEQDNVEIRLYGVIYDIENEIKQAMVGLLEPTFREKYLGRAEVRETFRVPKVGIVAGCYVQDGIINRNAELRLLRDNVVIYEGRFGSLKRFKDDASEVRSGYECGISIAGYNDVKIGDVIEAFEQEEIAPQLN